MLPHTEGTPDLLYLEAGRHFDFQDLVSWCGKDEGEPFEEVATRIDTVVFGPHASAAFPSELRPFISPALTRRKQHDYSDVITSAVGRAWAKADPGVVFVEAPHSRVVGDLNRPPIDDPIPHLRTFFERLRKQRAGESVGFVGIDGVRPITFANEEVLVEPDSEEGWEALAAALDTARCLGSSAYVAAQERVLEMVLASRAVAPQGKPLQVIGLHDTMNTKMHRDGAVTVERPMDGCMPWLVNFGNCGDAHGEYCGADLLTPAAEMRGVAQCWEAALSPICGRGGQKDMPGGRGGAISLNVPYAGGHEVCTWAARLRQLVSATDAPLVFQVEFERKALLGPVASQVLLSPGSDWPCADAQYIAEVAIGLRKANDAVRAHLRK